MFACVDGPDFDGHQVDFDDLMNRLKRYAEEESLAMERWSESCRQSRLTPASGPESRLPAVEPTPLAGRQDA
jgi:hypothetical protein